MALVYVAIAIACCAFAGRAIAHPFNDGDLFWQSHLGAYVMVHHALPHALGPEAFAASGAPWTAQEWLIGILAAMAFGNHALWAAALLAAAGAAVALWLAARRAFEFGASPFAVAFCTALLAFDLEWSFGIRAQVLAWPFFAAVLYFLDRRGRAIFWALPMIALWANVHASVMLAIPIVWIDALFCALKNGARAAETRNRLLLAVATPFAILVTPLGWRLPVYAFTLVGSPIRRFIDEWQPIGPHHSFFWVGGWPMLLIVACFAGTLARERPRDLAWLVVLLCMTVAAARNAALLGFVLMPLAARALELLVGRYAWWPGEPLRSPGPRRLAIVGGAATAALVLVASMRAAPAKDAFVAPVATFEKIAALPGDHRVFCYDFAICSIALDHPNLQVLIDGRADPFPLRIWYDWDAIRRASPGWKKLVDGYRIDVAVVKRGDLLDGALLHDSGWRTLATPDRRFRTYVRTLPQ